MNFPQLSNNIQTTHDLLQNNAMRAVNQNITARNWLVGYWIVEFEQNGEDRAKYGERLLSELSRAIHIKGMGATMLSQCRKFYTIYPQIGIDVERFLRKPQNLLIFQTLSENLRLTDIHGDTIFQSPIEKLQTVEEQDDRIFQTVIGKFQIIDNQNNTIFQTVSEKSNEDEFLVDKVGMQSLPKVGSDKIKSPYVFDFLGLRSADVVEESDLEFMLISHIQEFILEFGEGFCFEKRQKRILIDGEYFFVDLVFYHRILKCHVLVELKTRKFNYADMAQLNMYVAYYRDKMMTEGDNAPIGILLCTDASSDMVRYATAGMDENLFVSKYLLQLPAKEAFMEFLNKEMKRL